MVNLYRRGRIQEKKTMNWMRENGWTNLHRSAGSRGPADVYGRSPSGVKTYVQVKSGTARLSKKEYRDLRKMAKERDGAALYVHKDENGIKSRWLGNWSKRG
jgi:Holliday junction resolvase-like predicted endonuclease